MSKSKKQRINLYVDAEVYQLMKDLAALKKVSVSQLVSMEFWTDANRKYRQEHIQELQQYSLMDYIEEN